MTTGELLSIDPQELQFPFELKKQISCSLNLSNKTNNYVAFKVKTTNPRKYCVKPNNGVVLPWSTWNVTGLSLTKLELIYNYLLKRKHLLICNAKISFYSTRFDFKFGFFFNKESGHHVEECKLRVAYVAPPRPPSPVKEGSEEGSSPRASVSDNGSYNSADLASKRALISKLNEEKNATILENNKLQQELELLGREAKRDYSGMKFVYVILVGLVSIILGYLLKLT
ncbi:hypothetical protein ES332_D12G115100v1 [Gossypium tomentosum]|uniref:MSP domain-containing protein n=1 Tax=Gossypium tomentosum TaxID=34277 RepID=A0A5D2I972_GOSTO|nr:hypothetical protein ES332_D12G115100v1 [Gossypium tomentosum]